MAFSWKRVIKWVWCHYPSAAHPVGCSKHYIFNLSVSLCAYNKSSACRSKHSLTDLPTTSLVFFYKSVIFKNILLLIRYCLQCFDTWLDIRKSIWPVKIEWWHVGVVICLERGADFCIWSTWCHCIPKPHHLLPRLSPDWFAFLVPARPGCPGKEAVKRV